MNWAELLVPLANVLYVVIAIIMVALILMQRGSGAQAGASLGAGASGTVFGAQGSANFLSRATAVCATLFFIISFGMGVYISHGGRPAPVQGGFMGDFKQAAPAASTPANAELPAAPASSLPTAAPASSVPSVPTATSAEVPAAIAPNAVPAAESVPKPSAPVPAP
jgi:preprotein translocase subunit SecG